MNFNLRSPCKHCPFRTDISFPLHPARAKEITDALVVHQQTFACHKTTVASTDDNDEGDLVEGPKSEHCAGALIMLEKLERPNQMMRWMERLGRYDRTKLDMDAPVFATPRAMIDRMKELTPGRRKKKRPAKGEPRTGR